VQAPAANAIIERRIGTIRREVLGQTTLPGPFG
jgi:hypothetical protein